MTATDGLRSMAASVGLAIPQAATLMMEAADTIEGLEAKNAKLRDYVERKRYLQDFGRLVYENTRLRELVRAAWKCIHSGSSCSDCRLIAGGCTLQSAMRELGIEVGR